MHSAGKHLWVDIGPRIQEMVAQALWINLTCACVQKNRGKS